MVVTSSKNVVRIFFAFTTLTATKKAYRIYGKFWKDRNFPPIFLVPFTTFYYFLLPNWKILAVKSLAVKL